MTEATQLLSPQEAAARLGVEKVTLDKWRSTKKYRLAYTKIGGKVLYPVAAVEDFIRSRTITPGEPQEPIGRARRQRRLRSEK
jgi:excisionase family DNA binding protein